MITPRLAAAALAFALALAFVGPGVLPAQSAPAPAAAAARKYTAADVAFMQGMIGHHAQALEMTALIADRSTRRDMGMLGERISVSQRDEIRMMGMWLTDRGETVPAIVPTTAAMTSDMNHEMMNHAAMQHDASTAGHMMPGMLTAAQMDTLKASKGAQFDTRFLRYMIQHHEGALLMVKQLLATPGAAEEPQIYGFASDVDTDQRAEIRRMQALLKPARSAAKSEK